MSKAMGFLDKLWDETLAGPAPERGLGKLRKYKSLSAVGSSNDPTNANHYHDHHDNQTVPVTRSITILRTKNLCVDPGSLACSPTTSSSGPSSPFSPGETGKNADVNRSIRKKPTFDPSEQADANSPTVYDWILISALDR